MRIPITYIILAVIVVGVWLGAGAKVKGIERAAAADIKQQQEENLRAYRQGAGKVKDAEWAMRRSWLWLQNGNVEMAIILLERVTELDKNYRDAQVYLGYAHMAKVAEGLTAGNQSAALTPEGQRRELETAKTILLGAQKLDPLYPLTNKLLGVANEQLGNDKEAKIWYARYEAVSGP